MMRALFIFLFIGTAATAQVPVKVLINDVPLHTLQVNRKKIWACSYGAGLILTSSAKGWTHHKLDSGYYEQLQRINDKTGVFVGEKSTIFRTLDDGATWETLNTLPLPDIFLYAVNFNSEDQGIVSGFRLELRDNKRVFVPYHFTSIDGGRSWKQLITPHNPLLVHYYKSPDKLLGTGRNTIVKVSDDHKTFSMLYYDSTGQTGDIRGIHFADRKNAAAVSFNGFILITSDGGLTWKPQSKPGSKFRDVVMLNAQTILAVGNLINGNNASLSIDAGKTWRELKLFDSDIHRIILHRKKLLIAGKAGLAELTTNDLKSGGF